MTLPKTIPRRLARRDRCAVTCLSLVSELSLHVEDDEGYDVDNLDTIHDPLFQWLNALNYGTVFTRCNLDFTN